MHDLEKWYGSGARRHGRRAASRLRSAVYLRELYKLDALRAHTWLGQFGNPVATGPAPNALIGTHQRVAPNAAMPNRRWIGHAYEAGIGVVQDKAEALRWYARAGTQGNVHAQYLSGLALGVGAVMVRQKNVHAGVRHGSRRPMRRASTWPKNVPREAIASLFWTFNSARGTDMCPASSVLCRKERTNAALRWVAMLILPGIRRRFCISPRMERMSKTSSSATRPSTVSACRRRSPDIRASATFS